MMDHINWEVTRLANIKSAKKRVLVSQKKAARNKAVKSKVKTYVKKVDAAIAAGDKAAAQEALKAAVSEINKAARLSTHLNQLVTHSAIASVVMR